MLLSKLIDITKRAIDTQFSDLAVFERNKPFVFQEIVKNYEGYKTTEGRKWEQKEEKVVKDDFRMANSISLPFIDHKLYSFIRSKGAQFVPESYDYVSYQTTRTSDEETLRRYRKSSILYPRTYGHIIAYAGIESARQLGIYNVSSNSKVKTLGIKRSIIETSKNTSSGYPLFKKKNNPVAMNDTKSWLTNFLSNPTRHSLFRNILMIQPSAIFHRFQPSVDEDDNNIKVKTRQVWCIPYRIIALQRYFFGKFVDDAIINNQTEGRPVYSSGLTNFEISTKIISRFRKMLEVENRINSGRSLYSLDFKKYDQTVPLFAIDLFYSIILEQLDLSNEERHAFNLLRLYEKYTPYIYIDKIGFKTIGMSSGSLLTNLLDTWFNLTIWILVQFLIDNFPDECNDIVSGYLKLDSKFMAHKIKSKGLDIFHLFNQRFDVALCGDDTLVCTSEDEIILHQIVSETLFGMKVEVNVNTTHNDGYIFFLGRYWDYENRPVQTFKYMSSHIIFRSKYYKPEEIGSDLYFLDVFRILSICCPLYNGWEYINKIFYDYPKLKEFLNSGKPIYYLKEWPSDKYNILGSDLLYDWRNL